MLCEVVYLRKYMNYTGKIAAISPCIGKGDEFRQTGLVQYNVTMDHLKRYFIENEINLPDIKIYSEFEFVYHFDVLSLFKTCADIPPVQHCRGSA